MAGAAWLTRYNGVVLLPVAAIIAAIKTLRGTVKVDETNPEKPVILRTDPDASYGDMIRVFDNLRTAHDEWTDEDGQPLYTDVHGKPLTEIQTISIPTQREIESLWSMLGIQ